MFDQISEVPTVRSVVKSPTTQTESAHLSTGANRDYWSRRDRWISLLLAPVDASSLYTFRIGFGFILFVWAIDYLSMGLIRNLYLAPRFHFSYYLFDFVRPWSGDGMYVHFMVLAALAVCVAIGFLYRVTSVLLAVGFTYVFLLDRTNYQNHYYLILMLCWLLAVSPAHRGVSLDVLGELATPSVTTPAVWLWLIRFHIGLPYFFGGIAKLHPDWLAGEPMRTHLASKAWLPLIGPWFTSDAVVMVFAWGGLLFDLSIVPLLLWRRTQTVAYLGCIGFHLLNALLFNIHVFPWFMIVATTIFFEPDWPRLLTGYRRLNLPAPTRVSWKTLTTRGRYAFVMLGVYCSFHMIWPLRHYCYPGDAMWTEQGHYFSWRMMLRGKVSALRYYVTDRRTGVTSIASLRPYLNIDQLSKFSRDPEMILQFAHFLAHEYRTHKGSECEVRALVLTSLNGRKPQLLIDPNVDLSIEPLGFHTRTWIMPLTEPLRKTAWSEPLVEWERHVTLPPLTFLDRAAVAAK